MNPRFSDRARVMAGLVRQFLPYEVPLADGETARLVLPVDLTQEEADRICGVIQSLAFTDSGAAPK